MLSTPPIMKSPRTPTSNTAFDAHVWLKVREVVVPPLLPPSVAVSSAICPDVDKTVKFTVSSVIVAPFRVALMVRTPDAAPAAITRLAVMVVAFTQVGEVTVILVPLTVSATVVHVRVVPVSVIGTVVF